MHVSINNDLCKTKDPPRPPQTKRSPFLSPGYRQTIIKN